MRRNISILFFLFHICFAVFSQNNPHQTNSDHLFYSGDYEKAIPALREHLISHPHNPHIKKMLAKSFLNTGNADSAYILHKEIIEHNPEDYDSHVFIGNYYYVIAKKITKTETTSDEKRTRFFLSKKGDGKITPDTISKCYRKAGEHLEKAYTIYNSDEIRKFLIDIYTITDNKDKVALYKRNASK